jgi:Flp pilus assembly pilin Flp
MITETVSDNIIRLKIPMIQRLSRIWTSFLRDEEAATAVEYALLIALISIFSISAILHSGEVQKALWFDTADDIQIIAP